MAYKPSQQKLAFQPMRALALSLRPDEPRWDRPLATTEHGSANVRFGSKAVIRPDPPTVLNGQTHAISPGPQNGSNPELIAVGARFGVIELVTDPRE
jgi:hypothetical protein